MLFTCCVPPTCNSGCPGEKAVKAVALCVPAIGTGAMEAGIRVGAPPAEPEAMPEREGGAGACGTRPWQSHLSRCCQVYPVTSPAASSTSAPSVSTHGICPHHLPFAICCLPSAVCRLLAEDHRVGRWLEPYCRLHLPPQRRLSSGSFHVLPACLGGCPPSVVSPAVFLLLTPVPPQQRKMPG